MELGKRIEILYESLPRESKVYVASGYWLKPFEELVAIIKEMEKEAKKETEYINCKLSVLHSLINDLSKTIKLHGEKNIEQSICGTENVGTEEEGVGGDSSTGGISSTVMGENTGNTFGRSRRGHLKPVKDNEISSGEGN